MSAVPTVRVLARRHKILFDRRALRHPYYNCIARGIQKHGVPPGGSDLGAGLAGRCHARYMQGHGISFHILEASDEIGGRRTEEAVVSDLSR